MLRRLTTFSFVAAMITILALKHPALAFCTSEHKIISIATCSEAHVEQDTESCCESCSLKTKKAQSGIPHKSCSLGITLDVGQFVWENSANEPSAPQLFAPPIENLTPLILSRKPTSALACIALQNAPPPRIPSPEFTGVYRL